MAEYIGSAIVVSWIHSAGTATISGNYTTFTWSESVNLVDASAGADANVTRLVGIKDGQASMSAKFVGGTDTGGTATFSTLVAGAVGTLQWQPEGTAGTKPNFSVPAISNGRSFSHPYSDVVVVDCSWSFNGALTESANA